MQRYYGRPYARLSQPQALAPQDTLDQYQEDVELQSDEAFHPNHRSRMSVMGDQSSHYDSYRAADESFDQPVAQGSLPPYERSLFPPPSEVKFDRAPPSNPRWSRQKKWMVLGTVVVALILIIIGIAVGVALGVEGGSYNYIPSTAKVTNDEAFWTGGATRSGSADVTDGVGAGTDEYTYYSGTAANFPNHTSWISFDDMWKNNLHVLQTSCETLGEGSNNSPGIISGIHEAIQNRANVSLVDHRLIFAIMLQESQGCVHVKSTTSSSGVQNPGLMQSHNGVSFSSRHRKESIFAMIQDGTQGTASGDGLVQNLNLYGNPYKAARGYNSGYIPTSGNLSEAAGATSCYVSDVANRLLGWVNAKSTCP